MKIDRRPTNRLIMRSASNIAEFANRSSKRDVVNHVFVLFELKEWSNCTRLEFMPLAYFNIRIDFLEFCECISKEREPFRREHGVCKFRVFSRILACFFFQRIKRNKNWKLWNSAKLHKNKVIICKAIFRFHHRFNDAEAEIFMSSLCNWTKIYTLMIEETEGKKDVK